MSSITSLASTSSSSAIPKRFKYDVFISFRGEDTRKTFVGHLYQALKQKGLETFKDDEEMKQGKTIDNQLIHAIKDSRFFIIVFSKNYASSSWCLDELVEIMECQKTGEQTAYPVFFHVEPTQVRKQSGAFGEAFLQNKSKDTAGKWIEALKGASNLAGRELQATANGHEAEFIKKIVGEISLELRSISFGFDEKLVGMETRVEDVVDSLEMGIDDDVWMIGIKGMGGAGKTTTARAVFDRLSADFEAKSFVANVREVSEPSMSGLKKLQEQVLSRVLNEQVTLDSVYDGKKMMQERMRGIKVLLVLDDVNHIDQLVALAGETNWFNKGSRIIVTTRDEQVLQAHRVNFRDIDKVDHRVKIRDIDLLSDEEAIFLFSRHAFGRAIPSQGFKKLSGKVVRYAAGLPLTLKVLGSFLCGKDEHEWKDAIERLKEIPLQETREKLELSYTSLDKDYKEIFLDIACILKGMHKEEAIRILECCGFRAINGLKVLEQRSLITISPGPFGEPVLGMHDHIEEMGKNIVRREHPNEPNKHSRLWINEEVEDILANDEGTETTICLEIENRLGNKSDTSAETVMKGLGKMKQLRYLRVDFQNQSSPRAPRRRQRKQHACCGGAAFFFHNKTWTQYFPNSSKYLECTRYPFLYLPKTFQANNLVGLQIHWSRSRMGQLWEEGEKKVLPKLKFLYLYYSNLTTFDFRITPNLEKLFLESSFSLVKLFMPVSCQKLNYLHISSSKLRTFDLGLTPNLEKLSLIDFEELHMSSACPNLKFLEVCNSRLRSLDLELFPNLERLDLNYCADFEELQVSGACPNLKFLELRESRLRSLHLELFPNLERLDLKGCDKLVEINAPVGCLRKLVYLNLYSCLRFSNFVVSVGGLEPKVSSSLASLRLVGKSLDLCPLHPNINLPKFGFYCIYEENLPSSVGNIEKLISFGLCACTDLKKFSDMICSLRCLRKLELECDIPEIPKDLGKLECLEELCLSSTKIKHLPDSICMLKCLKSLKVDNGDLLEKLPEDLGKLECLERLYVWSKKIEYLPDSICMLKCLKSLKVNYDDDPWKKLTEDLLEKLPEDLGQLECLEELCLSSTKIKHLPDSICMLKCLKSLQVKNGDLLEKLPENLGQLECLEELCLSSTKIKHLPDSICMLKCLKSLKVDNGDLLEKLPEDLGKLECLERLYVWSKKIEYLPDSICMLKCLKSLKVNYDDDPWKKLTEDLLEKLPEDLGQLECLEELCLSSTKIKHLPDSICMLKCLKSLQVKNGDLLEKLPENLGQLECLEELCLSSTKIKHLPDSICMLKCLKSLKVDNGDLLEKLPEDLGKLECLERLYVWSKKIEYLPDSICMLKCLKSLKVNYDDDPWKKLTEDLLEKLPEDLGQLECLEELCLSSTKIKHLPDSICMLKCLKSLQVKNGDLLEKLPENLGQLECLEELCLSSTKIKHLPDSICMLKCLKSLQVKNGDLLEKLPENLGQLECLEKLYVRSKKIKHLPDSICMLKCLKSLQVNFDPWKKLTEDLLEKLPEDLGQLECLEQLYMRSKKIEYLPDSICMLKRLKSLDVSDCSRLGKLPEDIGQLESLKRLDLSATKIKHLPNSICMLKHLTFLNLHGCVLLEKLPEDIAASPKLCLRR